MGIFDKFKPSNTTAEFSWPAVDPMGNPVGYQQDELETEKDKKLKKKIIPKKVESSDEDIDEDELSNDELENLKKELADLEKLNKNL